MLNGYRRSIELALLISILQPIAARAQTAITPARTGPFNYGLAAAGGQATITLTGAGSYNYDSNVFAIQSGMGVPGYPPGTGYGDTFYTATAALDVKYQSGRQTLHGDITGTSDRYQKFTELDHYEYKLDAGWKGYFASLWDGSFDVTRDRAMVPFKDVTGQSTLSISTEQREDAALGLQFAPRWRIDTSAYTRSVNWPLPETPDLKVSESQGQATLKYLGTASVTSGLSVGYLAGSFSGVPDPAANPSYRQWTTEFVANYMSGHSTLVSHIGYSSRLSGGAFRNLNSTAGVTGGLDYTNQVTGKTLITVDLARTFTNFITDEGTEIDNTAGISLTWQATYKTRLAAGYTYDYAQFPGQGTSPGTERLDHLNTATLEIDYVPRPWVTLKPYASLQTRSSDLPGGNFEARVYGVNIMLTLEE